MELIDLSLIALQIVALKHTINRVIVSHSDQPFKCFVVRAVVALSELQTCFLQGFHRPSIHRSTHIKRLEQNFVLSRVYIDRLFVFLDKVLVLLFSHLRCILDEGFFIRDWEMLSSNLPLAICTADTWAVFVVGDLEVAVVSPAGAPGILHEVVLLRVLGAVSDSEDTIVEVHFFF